MNTIGKFAMAACFGLALASQSFAQFQLLDNGTGTLMVASDGQAAYALKNNGNIWCFANGQWQMIDNGSGTRQIAAAGGYCYALKNNGEVWRRAFGQWQK